MKQSLICLHEYPTAQQVVFDWSSQLAVQSSHLSTSHSLCPGELYQMPFSRWTDRYITGGNFSWLGKHNMKSQANSELLMWHPYLYQDTLSNSFSRQKVVWLVTCWWFAYVLYEFHRVTQLNVNVCYKGMGQDQV